MKCHKPNTDQEATLTVYANGEPCTEHILPTSTNSDPNVVECFIPVKDGDHLTIKGHFNGSVLHGAFDLLVDGSFLVDKKIEGSKNGDVKHYKRRLDFLKAFDTPRPPGYTSTYTPLMTVEGDLHVKSVDPGKTGEQSGTGLGLGSLAVIVSINQKTTESYEHKYPSTICGEWRRWKSERASNGGIPPEHELEVKVTDDEVHKNRQSTHRRRFAQTRFGEKPWAKFIFYYRTRDAITEAGCLMKSEESQALEPGDADTFIRASTERKPKARKDVKQTTDDDNEDKESNATAASLVVHDGNSNGATSNAKPTAPQLVDGSELVEVPRKKKKLLGQQLLGPQTPARPAMEDYDGDEIAVSPTSPIKQRNTEMRPSRKSSQTKSNKSRLAESSVNLERSNSLFMTPAPAGSEPVPRRAKSKSITPVSMDDDSPTGYEEDSSGFESNTRKEGPTLTSEQVNELAPIGWKPASEGMKLVPQTTDEEINDVIANAEMFLGGAQIDGVSASVADLEKPVNETEMTTDVEPQLQETKVHIKQEPQEVTGTATTLTAENSQPEQAEQVPQMSSVNDKQVNLDLQEIRTLASENGIIGMTDLFEYFADHNIDSDAGFETVNKNATRIGTGYVLNGTPEAIMSSEMAEPTANPIPSSNEQTSKSTPSELTIKTEPSSQPTTIEHTSQGSGENTAVSSPQVPATPTSLPLKRAASNINLSRESTPSSKKTRIMDLKAKKAAVLAANEEKKKRIAEIKKEVEEQQEQRAKKELEQEAALEREIEMLEKEGLEEDEEMAELVRAKEMEEAEMEMAEETAI